MSFLSFLFRFSFVFLIAAAIVAPELGVSV